MYSQNNEEEIILSHFAEAPHGTFLDIGAYDGKKFSNTLALVERGWNGFCLEPDPTNFHNLALLHADNPRVVTLKLALAKHTGPLTFYTSGGDGISTSDQAHREKWQKNPNVRYTETTVDGICWADFIRRFAPGYVFDFVNLDVEGQNWPLLQTINLDAVRCRVLCVEHDGEDKRIKNFLGPAWRRVLHNAENVIYVR